jgi:hypothetical protein
MCCCCRSVILPLRLHELVGDAALQLVAVEALHVVSLLQETQRRVRGLELRAREGDE